MNVGVIFGTAGLIVFALLARPCTIFYATDGATVLVGNNEDFDGSVPLRMWFVPSGKFGYGRVCFGWYSHAQGGMNDRGLFLDWAALPDSTPKPKANGKPPPDGCMAERALATCATVEDVLRLLDGIAYEGNPAHFLAVDKSGNSIVGEWLESGLKPIRRKDKQIITNFLLTSPPSRRQPCARYNTVSSMLGEKPEVTVANFSAILKSTAANFASGGGTKYSNIYDLTRGTVTLYVERNFARPITLIFTNELRRGFREVDLYALATNGPTELLPPGPKANFATLPAARHVLDRFRAARGDATALTNVRAYRLNGRATLSWGDAATFEFMAAPGRRAESFAFAKLGRYQNGYDGTNAWQVQPATSPIQVDGAIRDHARRDAAFFNWQCDAREVTEPVRLVSFDGRDCFALSLTQSGVEATHYFDVESGVLAGIVTTTALRSGTTWSRTFYTGWRNFSGVLFPSQIRIQEEGYELTAAVDKVEINDLPLSAFTMPAVP
jgi:hypothetical protein